MITKTQLNIEGVKLAVQAAELIGEGAKVDVHGFHYSSREEAQEVADKFASEFDLNVFENESTDKKLGWFTVADGAFGSKIAITLFFDKEKVNVE